jgi:hypothetical protein
MRSGKNSIVMHLSQVTPNDMVFGGNRDLTGL